MTKNTPTLRFKQDGKDFPNWSPIMFGEIVELLNGYAFKSSDFSEFSPNKVIRMSDLKAGRIADDDHATVEDSVVHGLERFGLQHDDFLFGMSGSLSNYAWIKESDLPAFLNQRVGCLREKKPNIGRFAHYLYLSSRVQRAIESSAAGAAQLNISSGFIKGFELDVPSPAEQRKIAEFLTAVDGRIAQLERKKALLEDYKKGVMQQLFTQAIRFKDDHGKDFPEWEENEFGEIAGLAKEKYNPMKSKKCFPCVELESLSQNTGKLLETFPSSGQKSIKSAFKKGDVLFGKLRPYLRKFHHAETDGVCSTEIWVMRGRTVTNGFLFHLIQSHKFNQAANVSSGSKMPRSDWEYLSSVPFAHPSSEEEQTKIAEFLTALDRKIEGVGRQIAGSKGFKRGLLQQMFV